MMRRITSRRIRPRARLVLPASGALARVLPLALALLLALLLAGCGGTRGTGGAASHPATPPSQLAAPSSFCPSALHSMGIVAPAVILKPNTPGRAATANVGQTVVVELPNTMRWQYSAAASSTAGTLAARQPSGAEDAAIGVCFWTWQAQASGTATLTFTGSPLCTPDTQVCPQTAPAPAGATSTATKSGAASATGPGTAPRYIMLVSFTVHVT